MKDTITLKGVQAVDVYKEVIGFMAVNGYNLYPCVEPVKIVGKKKGGGMGGFAIPMMGAELEVGFWQQGDDLTMVLDFNNAGRSDADTVKGLVFSKFGQKKTGKS